MEDSHIRRTVGDGRGGEMGGCSSYFLGVEKEVLVPLREFSSKRSKPEHSLPGRLYRPG